jgi:4-amino-4-deoxy-L-arabinose transferase-like glycosyltransferase
MFWGSRAFGARAGLWAGAIAAVYPELVALGGTVLSEAMFMPILAIQLAFWTMAWQARQPASATASASRAGSVRADLGWSAAAGAAAGLATLVRPSWLLFTPLAIVVEFVVDRRSRGAGRRDTRGWLAAAAMLASFLAVMSPWWIRNALVTGHFVPTTLQVGASLYDGLNPAADGSSQMAFAPVFAAALAREDTLHPGATRDSFELRLDAMLRGEAWRWAVAHQGQAVQLAFIKLGRVWNIWPNEPAFRSWAARLIVLCSYVPVATLGVVGAWRLRGVGWPAWLCWLPAVYVSLLHMVFVGSLRYREPAMMGLIVLAAAECSRRRWFAAAAPDGGDIEASAAPATNA